MRWWARLLRRDRVERELDAELRYDFDRRVDDFVAAGMTPEDARRAAILEFGGLDQIKERCRDARGTRWLEDLAADTRYALRLLRKDRAFAAVAIVALGLGLAVFSTQFAIVEAYCLRGLPIDRPDRVAFIGMRDIEHNNTVAVSYADFADISRSATAFTAIAAAGTASVSLGDSGQAADSVLAAFVSVPTLRLLGRAPAIGRDFQDEDGRPGAPPTVLLSDRVWHGRYNADPAIVGRAVRIGGTPATIVGVMPGGFSFPEHPDIWMPLEQMPGLRSARRAARTLSVFARLRDGVALPQAQAELDAIGRRLAAEFAESNADTLPAAEPINAHYNGSLSHPAWRAFMIVGILVVVIACANVANLMLKRSAVRAREMAMRTAIGATRLRIVRQLLVESSVLASAGGLLGLALSAIALQLFLRAVPAVAIPYGGLSINFRVLAVLAAVTMGTVVVFGLVPALGAAPRDVGGALKTGSLSVTHDTRVRRWTTGFLTIEFGLTVLLVSAVGISLASFRQAQGPDARIDRDHLLTLRLAASAERYNTSAARRDLYERLGDRLGAMPGVVTLSFTSTLGLTGPSSQIEREGPRPSGASGTPSPGTLSVDHAYFSVLGLSLASGRPFDPRGDRAGQAEAIVNERLASLLFSDGGAIGGRIRVAPKARGEEAPWRTIVGIAPNLRQAPGAAPDPIVYLPFDASLPARPALLIRTTGEPAALAPLVREMVRGVDADLPIVALESARQAERNAGWNARISQNIIGTIVFIAVALATVGLYAVTAYGVARRRREIGIRVTLGARPASLIWLVARGAVVRVGAGFAAGFAMNVFTKVVGGPSGSLDPVNLLGIVLVLAIVALLATVAPALRALRVDPVAALRSE
jgi:putative ABC transport system permease protein